MEEEDGGGREWGCGCGWWFTHERFMSCAHIPGICTRGQESWGGVEDEGAEWREQ